MKRYHMSKNLFYKDNAETGVYIFRDGTITSNNAWNVSDYISVKPQTFYTISPITDQQTTAAYHNFYDSNKSIVSTVKSSATNQTLESPNNAAYVRISWRRSGISQIMLNEGSTALPYEEYYTPYWTTQFPPKYGTATDTLTSFPATVIPDGTNASTDIIGNMVQSGVPTPTTPIQPQECGERTGNLYQFPYTLNFSLSGSGNNRTVISTAYTRSNILKLKPNTTYYFTGQRAQATDNFGRIALFTDKPEVNSVSTHFYSFSNNGSTTFTTDATENYALVYLAQPEDYNIDYNMMLIEGSTALPYEPYGYKIPISSASTTTPVYLGEVQTTRNVKKLVLTGEEQFLPHQTIASWFQLFLSDIVIDNLELCTHYKPSHYNPADMQNGEILVRKQTSADNGRIIIKDTTYTTADDFKSYLTQQYAAGTPVCVWYVLAEPTTGIVNEPLRKIGGYADTVSGITIPTITGADSFDVLTTLKPSEVSLAYTGWHDATVKEWDGSEWQ